MKLNRNTGLALAWGQSPFPTQTMSHGRSTTRPMKTKILSALRILRSALGLALLSTLIPQPSAFAQGRISFANDSLHLVYFDTTAVRPGDASVAGQGVLGSSSQTPSGVTLVVDLYQGTSSSALFLLSSTVFSSSSPGRWTLGNIIVPGVSSGPTFFDVEVRDNAFPTEALSLAGGSYGGDWGIFECVVGSSIGYNSIVNPNAPSFSTWADGTFDASSWSLTGAGSLGAIDVHTIPEPSAFALAGVSTAALLLLRRPMGRRWCTLDHLAPSPGSSNSDNPTSELDNRREDGKQ